MATEKEKELVDLYEVVKNASDAALGDSGSEEESRCLDTLQELMKFPVNYHILVNTQVGKRLRSLLKHPRKKIQASAADLIEIWKKIIIDETNRNKVHGKSDNKPITAIKREASTAKIGEGPESMNAEPDFSSRPVKLPRFASENGNNSLKTDSSASHPKAVKHQPPVSTIKPAAVSNGLPKLTSMLGSGDAIRDKIRELLHQALSKVSGEADESIRDEVEACDLIRVVVSVESAMFEKWGRSNGAQKTKYRSLMYNMKDDSNPDFRRKVLLGQITPERIPALMPEEMASDQRKMENEQIKNKALKECERGGQQKATTDQFKCTRCGQRKCTYYQMQTRSADEPMTTYVTCVNCNKHWKFC